MRGIGHRSSPGGNASERYECRLTPASPTPTRRIPLVDVARGVALAAMTVYHFAWDLETFGYLLPGTIGQTGWVLFARAIATTFLFLAGMSLVLAHGDGFRAGTFIKRTGMVAGAALLVSIATRFTHPDAWIFFGILHAIALFSILSVPFARLPWWTAALAAVAVQIVDRLVADDRFTGPLWFLGLHETQPVSNDFVPLFPWWSATLAGVAAMKLLQGTTVWRRIGEARLPAMAQRPLAFVGQNSLLYYLVHQPVLIGALSAWVWAFGGPDVTPGFQHACQQRCEETGGETVCRSFCGCVTKGLAGEGLLEPFAGGTLDGEGEARADALIQQCRDASD